MAFRPAAVLLLVLLVINAITPPPEAHAAPVSQGLFGFKIWHSVRRRGRAMTEQPEGIAVAPKEEERTVRERALALESAAC